MTDALVVLTRSPVAGAGKSRLRAALGDAVVDRLTAALVADTLAWAAEAAPVLVVAVEGPRRGLDGILPASARVVQQPPGDLGARITAAIDAALDLGATRVVQVGMDSPTLPAGLLAAAFTALGGSAACLVPADDGGWVALGATRTLGRALAGVPWSRPDTAEHTVAALRRSGLDPAVLAPWYDLDDLVSLRRLARELRAPVAADRAPRTAALVGGIDGPALAAL